jgi:hypothetical protein
VTHHVHSYPNPAKYVRISSTDPRSITPVVDPGPVKSSLSLNPPANVAFPSW